MACETNEQSSLLGGMLGPVGGLAGMLGGLYYLLSQNIGFIQGHPDRIWAYGLAGIVGGMGVGYGAAYLAGGLLEAVVCDTYRFITRKKE